MLERSWSSLIQMPGCSDMSDTLDAVWEAFIWSYHVTSALSSSNPIESFSNGLPVLGIWSNLHFFGPDNMEMVCFRLPGHGDTTLRHMNSLRSRQHFCDITIVASNNQIFKGHKVVLAACSPFLRDQFLLNPSPRLQVGQRKHTHTATIAPCSSLIQSKNGTSVFLFHFFFLNPGVNAV